MTSQPFTLILYTSGGYSPCGMHISLPTYSIQRFSSHTAAQTAGLQATGSSSIFHAFEVKGQA